MTYEYQCESCGHLWEAEQSIKEAPLKDCVSCGQSTAKRLVSGGTGFLLKGGGWYADLYGSPAPKSGSDKTNGNGKSASSGDSAAPASEAKSVNDSKASSSSAASSTASAASAPVSKAS